MIALGAFYTLFLRNINYRNSGYTAGVEDSKLPTVSGSISFNFNEDAYDDGGKSTIILPVSGYKTLTVTTTNSTSGRRKLYISAGSTSKILAHNESATIDVSAYNSVTIYSQNSDQPVYATYTLIP